MVSPGGKTKQVQSKKIDVTHTPVFVENIIIGILMCIVPSAIFTNTDVGKKEVIDPAAIITCKLLLC